MTRGSARVLTVPWAVALCGLGWWLLGIDARPAAADPAGSHPHIYSLSRTYGRAGDVLTVRGIDFGATAPTNPGTGVLFDYSLTTHTGTQATINSWSPTTIQCQVPASSVSTPHNVGVVTDSHVTHAGAPPSPDPGASVESQGTPGMRDNLEFTYEDAAAFRVTSIAGSLDVVPATGYAAPSAGYCYWGDKLELTVTINFTLTLADFVQWDAGNVGKPVSLYLRGPNLDPRADYEARWEGRLDKYRLSVGGPEKYWAQIVSLNSVSTGNPNEWACTLVVSNKASLGATNCVPFVVRPWMGWDLKWGWNGATRDDVPLTPGDWSIVGIKFPESLHYVDSGGTSPTPALDAVVTTWGQGRVELPAPLTVTVYHPLDLEVTADRGTSWDRFDDPVGGPPSTFNGNDRLIPSVPANAVPRVWFSMPIPEKQGAPQATEGALPGRGVRLWWDDPVQDPAPWYGYAMEIVNQSRLPLVGGVRPENPGAVAMEVPEFNLAPVSFPADARFYANYPNPGFPVIPTGSVTGEASPNDASGPTDLRADLTRQGLSLVAEPSTPDGTGWATVRYLTLQAPINQPSVAALPLSPSEFQPAYYATTATLDRWTGAALDPQPSLGVAGDYTAQEARLYDPFLAKVFVNSDGSRDHRTGALTADLANLGPLADLTAVDLTGAPASVLGYWNVNYDENNSGDPFGYLYEEAYRSFILAVSVREGWDVRLYGMAGSAPGAG